MYFIENIIADSRLEWQCHCFIHRMSEWLLERVATPSGEIAAEIMAFVSIITFISALLLRGVTW